MNKFVKSALVMIPAAVLAGGLATSAVAHDGERSWGKFGGKDGESCEHGDRGGKKGKRGEMRGDKMGGERMQMMLAYKLNLTDAQEAELAEIFKRQEGMKQGHQGGMAEMHDALAKLTPGTAEHTAKIEEIAKSHGDMMAAGMKARAQMQADILNILNDEQKAEYEEMMEEMQERMGKKGKRGFFNKD